MQTFQEVGTLMCLFLFLGEQITFGVTVFLTMTLFMLVLADMIPAAADSLSKLGVFFNILIIEMFVMLIVMCYLSKMYNKSADDEPIPTWMRTYIFDYLSYKLCIHKRTKIIYKETHAIKTIRNRYTLDEVMIENEEETKINAEKTENNNEKPRVTMAKQRENTDVGAEQNDENNDSLKFRSISIGSDLGASKPNTTYTIFDIIEESASRENEDTHVSFKSMATSIARLMKRKNDLLISQRDSERKNKRLIREWKVCAMTFDRLALISFTLMVFVTGFVIGSF